MAYTQKVITDSNKSPLIEVLALMFLTIGILSCFVRTGSKLYMIKTLKTDDILTIVSTLVAVAQTIAIYEACEYGLGKHFDTLSADDTEGFFKSQYAANALFIASLALGKLSGAMGLNLIIKKSQRRLVLGCEIFVIVWGVTSLVVAFFQCHLPSPWVFSDPSQCISFVGFWTYFSLVNILTDVAIVAIVCENILKLQTSSSNKVLVIGVFGSRILVTPAIAAQIHYSNLAFNDTDITFASWQAAVTIELVQCLAILAVCLPNFKLFLDSLESGQIRIDDLRRQGKSSSNGYPNNYNYPTNRAGYHNYKSPQNSALATRTTNVIASAHDPTTETQASEIHEMADFSQMHTARTRAGAGKAGDDPSTTWDGQSHTSHTSQTILIHQTWDVQSVRNDSAESNVSHASNVRGHAI